MSDQFPKWQPNVRYRKQLGGRITLVRGVDVYQLDEISNLIWGLCDGAHSVADITNQIVTEYEVDTATAEEDCQLFLSELTEADLIAWEA